jgi:hypothetical protein
VGLVGQAGDLLLRLYDYVQQVRSAKKEIYDLYTEIVALQDLLEEMQNRQNATIHNKTLNVTVQSSQLFKDTLKVARELLQSMLDDLKPRKESTLSSLTWPKHKASVLDRTVQVERAKSYFILVLMNDAVRVLKT